MNARFHNQADILVIFNDFGIIFYDPRNAVYFPYGSIDTIKLSLLSVLQVMSHPQVCNFAVERGDKAAMKEAIAFAREAMKTAPKAAAKVFDIPQYGYENHVDPTLSAEEQLKQYKSQFVRGAITRDELEIHRAVLRRED